MDDGGGASVSGSVSSDTGQRGMGSGATSSHPATISAKAASRSASPPEWSRSGAMTSARQPLDEVDALALDHVGVVVQRRDVEAALERNLGDFFARHPGAHER